jgi:2-polyprenyl-3-methyl-5-hydroxy-6-metoxy-1,4-benzoquinol methylase
MSGLRRLAKKIRRAIAPRRGAPAVGSVAEVQAVYDDVFQNDAGFDVLDISNEPKLKYVIDFTRTVDGKVLDAGCGRGSVLRHMLDNGVDVFGVELSKSACDMYLQGVPHANADIISWADQGHTYDGLVCTDVLEHIPPDQIDGVIDALSRLSPRGLLGIANHSSIHNGHELHVIQKGHRWWMAKLGEKFSKVKLVPPSADDTVLVGHFKADRFFLIEVAR